MTNTSNHGVSRPSDHQYEGDATANHHHEYIIEFQRSMARTVLNGSVVRNPADADDVAQSATLWLLKNLEQLVSKYPNPRRLARVVANHRTIDWVRNQTLQSCARTKDRDGHWQSNLSLDSELQRRLRDDREDRTLLKAIEEESRDILTLQEVSDPVLEMNIRRELGATHADAFIRVRLRNERTMDVAHDLGISPNLLTHRLRNAERKLRAIQTDDPERLFRDQPNDLTTTSTGRTR